MAVIQASAVLAQPGSVDLSQAKLVPETSITPRGLNTPLTTIDCAQFNPHLSTTAPINAQIQTQYPEIILTTDVHMIMRIDEELTIRAVVAVVSWAMQNIETFPQTGKLINCSFKPRFTNEAMMNFARDPALRTIEATKLLMPQSGIHGNVNPMVEARYLQQVNYHELPDMIAEDYKPDMCTEEFIEAFCACNTNHLANACYVCQAANENPPRYLEDNCCCAPQFRRLEKCKTCQSADAIMDRYKEIILHVIERTTFPFSIMPIGKVGGCGINIIGPDSIQVKFV